MTKVSIDRNPSFVFGIGFGLPPKINKPKMSDPEIEKEMGACAKYIEADRHRSRRTKTTRKTTIVPFIYISIKFRNTNSRF